MTSDSGAEDIIRVESVVGHVLVLNPGPILRVTSIAQSCSIITMRRTGSCFRTGTCLISPRLVPCCELPSSKMAAQLGCYMEWICLYESSCVTVLTGSLSNRNCWWHMVRNMENLTFSVELLGCNAELLTDYIAVQCTTAVDSLCSICTG